MANPKLVANNEEFVMACKCPYYEHKWYGVLIVLL